MKVKSIIWTDILPSDSDIPYDHVFGECPLGRFLITWKSWKDRPSYAIDRTPTGEWGGSADTLEEAKIMAEDKYTKLIESCIEDSAEADKPDSKVSPPSVKILKYQLEMTTLQEIEMPWIFSILDVQMQRGVPCIWVLTNGHGSTMRKLRIVGTGEEWPGYGKYVGTFQPSENLVFHLFDETFAEEA